MSAAIDPAPREEEATDAGDRRALSTGAALFVLAAVLRLAHVWSVSASPSVRYPMVDSRAYYERAMAIMAGDWLGDRVAFQAPIYPYLVAGVYSVFGMDSVALLVLQALLGAATVACIYFIAWHAFDERCALLAGLLAAGYKVFFFYEALLLKPALTVFLITAALLLALRADETRAARHWIGAGAMLGFAILTRGNFLLFVPVLLVWIGLHRGRSTRDRLGACAGLLAGVALFVAPMTIRNYVVGDDVVLTTSQAGVNFYLGNYRGNATGRYASPGFLTPLPVTEERLFEMEAERRTGRTLKPSEQSRFWFREGLSEIAADPGHFVRHTGRKIQLFLNDYEIPDNQSYYFFREHVAPVLRLPLPTYGAIVPLALVGVFFVGRGREGVLLLLFLATYAGSVILFYVMSRYRMPAVPILLIFAARGALGIFDSVRARAWVRVVPALLALAVLYPWVHATVADDDFSVIRVNLGIHHLHRAEKRWAEAELRREAGEVGEAEALALEAVALESAAEEELRLGAELDPGNRVIHRRLGGLLVSRIERLHAEGRYEEALVHADQLATSYPRQAQAQLLLGITLRHLGRDAGAKLAFRRALLVEPDHPEALEALRTLEGVEMPDGS